MSESVVMRGWRRLPLSLRAVLSGLFVFMVLQNGWFTLFLVNTQVLPRVPWSVPLGAAWLWLFFRWFDGRGRPASTAASRRQALRAPHLDAHRWAGSLVYLVVFFAFLIALINVFYRFVTIPQDDYDLSMLPWWTLYPSLVMLSINAGVSEEAGFRGYMQGGLERAIGPAPAIVVTSLVFWLAHLNHASGPARFVLLMAMSIGLGALAWAVGSIRPAIVGHAALDTIFFVLGAAEAYAPWWVKHPPTFSETGVDASFVVFSAILVVATVTGGVLLKRLRRMSETTAASS